MVTPVLPAAEIDRGLVWPPLLGRALLQHALADAVVCDHHHLDDDVVITLRGWRLHSPAWFNDVEAARAVLVTWAQAHTRLLALLSSQRCVFVCADAGGYRVWQLVRLEVSVWQRLMALEHHVDVDAAAEANAEVKRLRTVCGDVAQRWSAAAHRLPCTLETIGAHDGAFIGLLPVAERLLDDPVVPINSSRLLQHLQAILEARSSRP